MTNPDQIFEQFSSLPTLFCPFPHLSLPGVYTQCVSQEYSLGSHSSHLWPGQALVRYASTMMIFQFVRFVRLQITSSLIWIIIMQTFCSLIDSFLSQLEVLHQLCEVLKGLIVMIHVRQGGIDVEGEQRGARSSSRPAGMDLNEILKPKNNLGVVFITIQNLLLSDIHASV